MTWEDEPFGDWERGDELIPGILGPDTIPSDEDRARYQAEFDADKAYRYETLQQFVERRWSNDRDSRNRATRRSHRAHQKAIGCFLDLVPRHAKLVLDGKVDESAAAIVSMRDWHESDLSIAVLAGIPGTGKSTAAAWWAWQKALCGNTHANPANLPTWITAAAFARSSRYDEDRTALLAADSLVLDDLGVEYADKGGSVRTDIDELVNAFYEGERWLVITTNLDARAFEKRYGARVVDRIAECGVWIPVSGPSRRRQ